MSDFTLKVHAFIEPRDGVFVATCLELGLVATSNSAEELPAIMEKLVARQVVFALENNNPSDLFRPAPPDVWERFRAARQTAKHRDVCRSERPVHVPKWAHVGLNQISYATANC